MKMLLFFNGLSLILLLISAFLALRLMILHSKKRSLGGGLILLPVLIAFHQVFSWYGMATNNPGKIDLFTEVIVCIASLVLVTGLLHINSLAESLDKHTRAEEALKEANVRLQVLIQSMPDIVTFKDVEGRHLLVNKTVENITGLKNEELIGKTAHDFLPRELADLCRQNDQEALRSSTSIHVEENHAGKNGETIFLDTIKAPIFDDKGNLAGLVSVSRDVTERKLAEKALRTAIMTATEEKVKSDAIIAAIGDSLVIIAPDFRIVYQNRVDREIIGNHVGEFCYQAFEAKDAVCEGCPAVQSFRDGQIHRGERIAATVKGAMHLEITSSPLRDSSGGIIAAIEVVRDVTERKQVEEALRTYQLHLEKLVDERTAELKRTNQDLRKEIAAREKMEDEVLKAQKLESLGMLAGGIAHDFNNLLTSIMGRITLALLDLDHRHPAYNQLTEAEQASLRAQELTQQLLTFSKGGAPIKRTASLGDIIRESATFALRGSRVRCEIQVPDGLWLVNVDEGQISQVVHNLAINADQAMPEGGTISVSCENTTLSGQDLSLVAAGKYVKITFRDNGVGIPKEHIAKVFDPYFSTKQQGSGLGLATTYSIIRKHGGAIFVESEHGSGATFTILLPASEEGQTAARLEDAGLATGAGKILLMDDEETVLQSTGESLRRLGYSVEFAYNGAQAIELYRKAMQSGEGFALVIMDLTIAGGMGGKETIERLAKIDPGVRAIVSSGYSNDPVMADFKSYGFAAVVPKPYRLKELARTVHDVINRRVRPKEKRLKEPLKDAGTFDF